ncbi:PIN domain-like protein [Suhomyces tanzawaensis NRRL Y-17324]|uniref:PIN domain-like protein n=1 Tax=Suhomyces tanzawaensis NRRL Y-17324 TaxID=984487 RepID=A0A1E4SQ63_9ASCO|nr:PIN domain-like protein [Suhomyces tanzawaensis NRRL Y-17324]ODV81651.1 PIN domain-like protein [Suhomyces tanzawaensis NRRL Y-17324]
MGITGLLPHLKEIQELTSLERFRGKTLAIDTYGWLHRGLISCAQELCQGQPTRKYINSILKKVEMLRYFGVEPYFVFDGASLPTKAETAKDRRLKREEAQKKADELTRTGNHKLAWKEFMKAACVTHEMAKSIMVELDALHIRYVVAPYEADPQMVYLEKIGVVDGILSEDSDLLIFGCNRLITKLKDDSSCVEICRDRFGDVKLVPHLATFSDDQLRMVALLSGCDYTKGIPGVGIKSAFNLIKKFNTLDKIVLALKSDGKTVPDDYFEEVNRANLAFQFQKVFDPRDQTLKTLNEYPADAEFNMEVVELCCGLTLNNELYRKICNGLVHPNNHTQLVSREQNLTFLKSKSINLGIKPQATKTVQSAQRTRSAIIKPSESKMKSVLDLLKTSKVKKEEIREPQTPARGIKRVISLISPTSKKLARISGDPASPTKKASKFFGNKTPPSQDLPTPVSGKQTAWDSSMVSGDSDFTEEFSSPVAHRITQTVIENLTDNDDDDIDGAAQRNLSVDSVEDSVPRETTVANPSKFIELDEEFGIEDDEIEESPQKPAPKSDNLSKFCISLRQSYLYQESVKVETTNIFSNTLLPKRAKPMEKLPTPTNSDEIQEDDFEISEDESQADRKPVLTAVNINTDSRISKIASSYTKKIEAMPTAPARQSVNLRQFAFRG